MRARLLTASILLAACAAGSTRADGLQERVLLPVLMNALTARYPAVTSWQVQPLERRAEARAREETGAAQVDVVRIGPRSAVRVRTPAGDGTLVQRTMWYSVAGMQSVLTANRSLSAGSALDSGRVAYAERDVVSADCAPLTDATGIENLRTRVAVRTGEVLCAGAVEPRPPVSRGEKITVIYRGPVVALTASGVAQSDGELGHLIFVRNPASRESFQAVVSGPQEVTIHD